MRRRRPGQITIGGDSNDPMKSHVFLLVDGKAVKRDVELGISNDELQEITAGVEAKETVITGPARVMSKLNDGDAVKLQEKKKKK